MEKDQPMPLPDKILNVAHSLQFESLKEVREKLIPLLNELINKDFHSLIQLLYRIDVSEKKIRLYLNEKPNEDAAGVLADLVIERQLQKIESRKKLNSEKNSESEEEKW